MADEIHEHTLSEPSEGTPTSEGAAESDEAHDDDGDAAPGDGASDGSGEGGRLDMPALNRCVSGRLTLHYPARDVSVDLDGDAAMRLVSMFVRQCDDVADPVDHRMSFAGNGWVSIDLTSLLAMTWTPQLRDLAERVSVDPAAA